MPNKRPKSSLERELEANERYVAKLNRRAQRGRVARFIQGLFCDTGSPVIDTDYEYVFPYASVEGPVGNAQPILEALEKLKHGEVISKFKE